MCNNEYSFKKNLSYCFLITLHQICYNFSKHYLSTSVTHIPNLKLSISYKLRNSIYLNYLELTENTITPNSVYKI